MKCGAPCRERQGLYSHLLAIIKENGHYVVLLVRFN